MKETHGLHRRLLVEAWHLAWQRRRFWTIGWVAGFVMSGTVIEPVISRLMQAARLGEHLTGSGIGIWSLAVLRFVAPLSLAFRQQPALMDSSVIGVIVLAAILLFFAFASQGALIYGLSEKEMPTVTEAIRHGEGKAGTLWMIWLVNAAFQLILVLLGALMILFVSTHFDFLSVFATSLAFILGLPLAFIGNGIALLASHQAVRRGSGVETSLEVGFGLITEFWLPALETSVILVGVQILGVFAFSLCATAVIIPTAILFIVANFSGWLLGEGLAISLGLLVLCGLTFTLAGWMNTFRYAVWVGFYNRISHPLLRRRIVAKLMRLFHPAHIR